MAGGGSLGTIVLPAPGPSGNGETCSAMSVSANTIKEGTEPEDAKAHGIAD